jgi:hypothetical protein
MSKWTTFEAPSNVGSFVADTMLLLSDGSVLIHEARGASWYRIEPNDEGSYEDGEWVGPLNMANTREFFSSAVLMDGRVYVVGGEDSSAGGDTPLGEIFDPQTNSWSALTKPSTFGFIQGDASGAVLPDGRVLFGNLQTASPPFTTAIWDPVTDEWSDAGSAFGTRTTDSKRSNCNEETWTLLPDGSVLTVATLGVANATERYVPSIDEWVPDAETRSNLVLTTITDPTSTVVEIFEIGPAILLPDKRVFAIGATGQTALYTPAPAGSAPTVEGTWALGPAFPADTSSGHVWPTLTASDAPAVLQTNGKVICVGGILHETPEPDYFSKEAQLFEFDPSDNSLKAFSPEPFSASSGPETWQCRFLLLPTGQILLTTESKEIHLYSPDAASNDPDASWRPALTSYPQTLVPGHTYKIEGTQLNGLSQAVSYGDDAQMATNYPIVRLSNSKGQVRYLRTFNFSTLAVATGTETVSAEIEVPRDVPAGAWSMVAIANGIASAVVDVEVALQDCYLLLERDTFGEGEIEAMINLSGAPAEVNPALYVVVEGYSAQDIGLDLGDLSNPAHKPTIPDPLSGISASFSGSVLPEDASLPAKATQRFLFPFELAFSGAGVFASAPQTLTLKATFSPPGQQTVSGVGLIYLTATPDPFILHGDVAEGFQWYQSTDVRVFHLKAGERRFGVSLASTGQPSTVATDYIKKVIEELNEDPEAANGLFESISQEEAVAETELPLAEEVNGSRVYSFALARVRLQDVAAASEVGVFFRMWQAQQTNATYDAATIYKSLPNPDGDLIPVLGVEGDEIITIPFFAEPRVNTASVSMDTQLDTANRRTIKPDKLGAEAHAYFGCWLDINQPDEVWFPDRMVGGNPSDIPAGPFTGMGPLLSVQQLVRSTHQCVIAEISFTPDPIPAGSDPSDSDKLAQRNLTLIPAPNPGAPDSRMLPQTLEIRPTPPSLPAHYRPDELMIEWGTVPPGSSAELYLPAASASEILELASTLYATHRLTQVDAHTIGLAAGDVSYVPIPPGEDLYFMGLLTVGLPAGIRKGEEFEVLVKQLTTASINDKETRNNDFAAASAVGRLTWRRVLGVFKLNIPISTKHELLGNEERTLSIMRWIAESIPTQSRWFPVFERYLGQLAERVKQMGGDPILILPSPSGNWREGVEGREGHHGHGEGHGGRGEGHGSGHHRGDQDHLELTGKIVGLSHDRFGDFDGFLLEERHSGEIVRFCSRHVGIAELAQEAWRSNTTVSVFVDRRRREVPVSIVFREPSTW